MTTEVLKVSQIARTRRISKEHTHGVPVFFPLLNDLRTTYKKLSFFELPKQAVGEDKRATRSREGIASERVLFSILKGYKEPEDDRTKEIIETIRDITDGDYKLERMVEHDGIRGKLDIFNDSTLIDLKDSTNLSTNKNGFYNYYNDFSQLILYYILGIKSRPHEFNNITRLIIFNINLGIYYTLTVKELRSKVDLSKILEIAKTEIPEDERYNNSLPSQE